MTRRCRSRGCRGSRRVAGFTLIELLVAVSILALTAMASWRGIDMVLRTHTKIVTNEQAIESIDRAFSQIDTDMANSPEFRRSAVTGEPRLPNRFVFVRTHRADPGHVNRSQVVLYTFENATLWRIGSPLLSYDQEVQSMLTRLKSYSPMPGEKSSFSEVSLIQDIEDFNVSFFCKQQWGPESSCLKPPTEQGVVINDDEKRQALRIALRLAGNIVYEKTAIIGF
jgi:type II secretion system protein J